jgi:DNA-binding NarL/FixJ family response regulator
MLDAGMKVPNIARKLNRTAQAIYARLQRIYRRRRATTPTRAAAP